MKFKLFIISILTFCSGFSSASSDTQRQIIYLSGKGITTPKHGNSSAPGEETAATGQRLKYPHAGSSRVLVIMNMDATAILTARNINMPTKKGCTNSNSMHLLHGKGKW